MLNIGIVLYILFLVREDFTLSILLALALQSM